MSLFSGQDAVESWQWQGNPAAVTEILRLNAMPLAYFHGRKGPVFSPLFESAEFIRELAKHQERCHQWKEAFGAVKNAFLLNDVKYAFIKSPSLFPYTSGNLDVLVREQDFDKAGNLLKQSGFVELKNIREPHKYLYKRFDCGKEIVAIHLHCRVFWGATFIGPDSEWSRADGRLLDGVVFPLSAEGCLLTTFAHSFYENSAISLLDLCVVKHLVDGGDMDWQYVRGTAKSYKWEDGFNLSVLAYERLHQEIFGSPLFPQPVLDDARRLTGRRIILRTAARGLRNDRLAVPFYLPLVTTKLLAYKKMLQSSEFGGMHRRALNLAKLLLEVLFIHILKLNPQKGMLVAISGMDGSGKSAHAHALVETLRACGLNTRYLWTRAGSQGGFLSLTKIKIFGRKSAASGQSVDQKVGAGRFQRTSRLLSARWRLIPWKVINVVDYCVFYNLMLRVRLLKRQVVVCDRYVPDIFVDIHSYVQEKPKAMWLRLLSWFLPRPTLSVLLTTPVDVALERSQDVECVDFIRRQAEVYSQAQRLLELTVVDNGHREFRDVCNELTDLVLHKYYGRKCVWFGWDQQR